MRRSCIRLPCRARGRSPSGSLPAAGAPGSRRAEPNRGVDCAQCHARDPDHRQCCSRRRDASPPRDGPVQHQARPEQHQLQRTIPQPKIAATWSGSRPNLRYADGTVPPVDVLHLHHGVWLNLVGEGRDVTGTAGTVLRRRRREDARADPNGIRLQVQRRHRPLAVELHAAQPALEADAGVGHLRRRHRADDVARCQDDQARDPVWMDVQNGSIYPVFDVIARARAPTASSRTPTTRTNPYGNGRTEEERVDGAVRRHAARDRGPRAPRRPARRPLADAPGRDRPARPHQGGLARHRAPVLVGVELLRARGRRVVGRVDVGHAGRLAGRGEEGRHAFDQLDVRLEERVVVRVDGHHGRLDDDRRQHRQGPVHDARSTSRVCSRTAISPRTTTTAASPIRGNYHDMTKLPPKLVASGTVLPIADFAYQGDMSSGRRRSRRSCRADRSCSTTRTRRWDPAHDHRVQGAVRPLDRASRTRSPTASRSSTPASSARFGPPSNGHADLDHAHGPAARHVHVLLPHPPVHAGRVPSRCQALVLAPAALDHSSAWRWSSWPRSSGSAPGTCSATTRPPNPAGNDARSNRADRATPDGTWKVVPATDVFVGYRMTEVFAGDIVHKTAVGRTPTVAGTRRSQATR